MAVANTYTLERRWGSRIVVKNMGFILNNDMRAFNLFPGQTDTAGSIGTPPNQIAPGKRPLSSMTPTIMAKNGRAVFLGGCSGSRAIPHTILCILVNAFDYHMSLKSAVEQPRFTQEWFPDHIKWESFGRFPETVAALQKMGYQIAPQSPLPFQGDAHVIFSPKAHSYVGVADDRISGKASGF
jgi:gamma-glutamyltranspeptidase/glutathione hydrolase